MLCRRLRFIPVRMAWQTRPWCVLHWAHMRVLQHWHVAADHPRVHSTYRPRAPWPLPEGCAWPPTPVARLSNIRRLCRSGRKLRPHLPALAASAVTRSLISRARHSSRLRTSGVSANARAFRGTLCLDRCIMHRSARRANLRVLLPEPPSPQKLSGYAKNIQRFPS